MKNTITSPRVSPSWSMDHKAALIEAEGLWRTFIFLVLTSGPGGKDEILLIVVQLRFRSDWCH